MNVCLVCLDKCMYITCKPGTCGEQKASHALHPATEITDGCESPCDYFTEPQSYARLANPPNFQATFSTSYCFFKRKLFTPPNNRTVFINWLYFKFNSFKPALLEDFDQNDGN